MAGPAPLPPAPPATLSQVRPSEREEQWNKAKENLNIGAAATAFGFSIMLGWVFVFLPKEFKHPGDVQLTVSLLLSFATYLSGKALMLLSLNTLGHEVLVSGGHRVATKCLVAACAGLSVLTLLSLLMALLPGRVHIVLAVVSAIMLVAAGTHWFLRRSTDGGGEAARDDEEQELDAASKTISCVTISAFGGLIGVLFSASKISSGVDAVDRAAIFFIFATAILGMFVMTVTKITN
ncbi:hypothetical protein BAE44_0004668 [Dichanthelium oligosanthes]|uniref:Uncharacterized protein n=1 Tax=Dichanthelium oligosanthes TaxID=888268 RepID=A0A1E5WA78_9POAL|nr:hypothetical protein BAE44_0004668 [Dichanthelium oligosanthes]